MNKYDLFFKSLKDFTLGLDLVKEKAGNNSGCIDKILNGERFDDAINSYLINFLSQVEFLNNPFGGWLFSCFSILECQELAIKRKIALCIRNGELITGWEERVANFGESEFLFLKHDEIGSSYMFVEKGKENPIIYLYWDGGDISTDDLVFTSYVRGGVFWTLIFSLDKLLINEKLDNLEWLKFYTWFYQSGKLSSSRLVTWRHEFNKLVEKKQMEQDQLLGVEEYEIEFIKYIIKTNGIEYNLDKPLK